MRFVYFDFETGLLDAIHVIVRSLKIGQQQQQGQQQQAHPLVAAVIQMWPMFERVASKIVSSAKVTEPLEIMVSKYKSDAVPQNVVDNYQIVALYTRL